MAERVTCAATSRACGEAVLGTASRARRWLLLEQPGSWGVDAVLESSLPPAVADHLQQLASELPCRVLLLRRTGGRASTGGRLLYAGVSAPDGGGWLEELHLDRPEDLLEVDLGPLAAGASVGGAPVTDPLYLVCTNGRHDPCCAEYGLPVARALDDEVGARVWECSHVGGDRFAANLVCLPDGVFYGHLDPDSARRAVAAHEAGRVLVDHLRGRSPHPFPVQAAEVLVRRALGSDGLDALRVIGHERAGDGVVRVAFALADGRAAVATVAVRREHVEPRLLTCSAAPARPPGFELAHLEIDGSPVDG